jgi:hypothetical protein
MQAILADKVKLFIDAHQAGYLKGTKSSATS